MFANVDIAIPSRCLCRDAILGWSEMGDEDITRFVDFAMHFDNPLTGV